MRIPKKMTKIKTGRALQLSLEFWPFTWNTWALASKNLGKSVSLRMWAKVLCRTRFTTPDRAVVSCSVEKRNCWNVGVQTCTDRFPSMYFRCADQRPTPPQPPAHLAVKEFLVHVIFHLRERKHFPKWQIARSLVLTKTPKWCQKPIAQQSQYPLELCSFCHPVNWWPLLLTYCSHFWQEKQYLSGGEAAEAPSGGYVIVEPKNRKIWW